MFHFYWNLTDSDDLQNTHWDYVSKNQNIQEYKIFDPWVGRPMIQKCLWYKLTAWDTLTGWYNNLKQDFIMETSCCAKKFCMLWPDRVEATLECIQTTASWIFLKHSVAVRAFITLANSKPYQIQTCNIFHNLKWLQDPRKWFWSNTMKQLENL